MTFIERLSLPSVLPVLLLFMMLPEIAHAGTLTKNTVWHGDIKVTEDILVPKGISLTIKAGTTVSVVSSESTKTDPEYVSPLTEITVRGTLIVEGTEKAPVEFSGMERKTGSWAGIMIDQGVAVMQSCRISNADTALYVIEGSAKVNNSVIKGNRYGVVAQGNGSDVLLENSGITENEYGVFTFRNARLVSTGSVVAGNRKKDSYAPITRDIAQPAVLAVSAEPPVSRRYQDEVFRGDTIWQGTDRGGRAGNRVPEGSRLVHIAWNYRRVCKKGYYRFRNW